MNWTANNAEIDHMVDKVAFMRESLPKRIELAVDMHGRYDVGTAKRMAKELEPFRLLWLEEPVPPENVDAMRDVRESTHTPICCGENLFLRHGFRELLEKRAVDIIMPDIQKCGGLLEARKIADMAHTYYVPMAPHCQASPIGTMASCHVLAAIPNALVLEWHWGHPAEPLGGVETVRQGRRHHREGVHHRPRSPGDRPGDGRRVRAVAAAPRGALVRVGILEITMSNLSNRPAERRRSTACAGPWIVLLVLFTALLVPASSQAQVFTWTKEQMIRFTAQNPFERFPDGRPKVPDALLEKVKGLSAEEVLSIQGRGYPSQYADGFQLLHPGKKLVGRAVTLQLMPQRGDVAAAQAAEWKEKGMAPLNHQSVIDMLQPGDVLVVDVGGNIGAGGIVGDNLAYYIWKMTGPGSSSTAPSATSRAWPRSTWRGTTGPRCRRPSATSW